MSVILGGFILLFFTVFIIQRSSSKSTRGAVSDSVYDEFSIMYNICDQINADLVTLEALPDNDPEFIMTSKARRLKLLEKYLTKWVNVYNSKTKLWGKERWHPKSLPFQLDLFQFSFFKKVSMTPDTMSAALLGFKF